MPYQSLFPSETVDTIIIITIIIIIIITTTIIIIIIIIIIITQRKEKKMWAISMALWDAGMWTKIWDCPV